MTACHGVVLIGFPRCLILEKVTGIKTQEIEKGAAVFGDQLFQVMGIAESYFWYVWQVEGTSGTAFSRDYTIFRFVSMETQ